MVIVMAVRLEPRTDWPTVLRAAGVAQVVTADEHGDQVIPRRPGAVVLIEVSSITHELLEKIAAWRNAAAGPIVLCGDDAAPQWVGRAVFAGVDAYVAGDPAITDWPTVLAAADGQFRRMRLLDQRIASLEASLEERKLVDRAKGLLMAQRGLTEPQAYRLIQKLAMDRKRRLVDVARQIIEWPELLAGG